MLQDVHPGKVDIGRTDTLAEQFLCKTMPEQCENKYHKVTFFFLEHIEV